LPFILLGIWENQQGTLLLQSQAAYLALERLEKNNPSHVKTGQPPGSADPSDKDQPNHGPF
jgi:hypothetical protein